jgi:predicted PurR-regulated permease PerM
MQRTPWLNVLIVLLTIIAGAYLAQMLWQLLSQFADIILLFVLAWLVAFALSPLIQRINGKPLPPSAIQLGERLFGRRAARQLERFRYTRLHAVAVVYLTVALILVEAIALFVPPAALQLKQLIDEFPAFAQSLPDYTPTLQRLLTDMGFRASNVSAALSGALGTLQNFASVALQNAFVILGGVLALVGNLLLVLLLSFFFALDGPRLFRTVFDLVPEEYDDEVRMLAITVDRTFGGFIRAQLLQAFLVGAGTAIVMALFGEPFLLVASLFAGFFMLIPFVGTALALIPPALATLAHDPGQLLLILIILLVYQVVVVNVVMPKLLSEALGLHPLIIIASLLVGIKIGGFWGAFFGVPVAGVIATMALFFYRRWARQHLARTEQEATVAAPPTIPVVPAPPNSTAPPPQRDLEKKRV